MLSKYNFYLLILIIFGVLGNNNKLDREDAINTINVLNYKSMDMFGTYIIFLDNFNNYPNQNFIFQTATSKTNKDIENPLEYLVPQDVNMQNRIRIYLDKIENSFKNVKFFYATVDNLSNITKSAGPNAIYLMFSKILLPIDISGYARISGRYTSITYSSDLSFQSKPWITIHEIMHIILLMTHNKDGEPLTHVPIESMNTEDTVMMYKDGGSWKSPGTINNDSPFLWLGNLDWSLANNCSKGIKEFSPHNITEIKLTGSNTIRGSPGPQKWYKKIIVGSDRNWGFFSTWYDSLKILWKSYSNILIISNPIQNPILVDLWLDSWDVTKAWVDMRPGRESIHYRTDRMKGPSFNMCENDTKLDIVIKDVSSAQIIPGGSQKEYFIDNVNDVYIIIGNNSRSIINGCNDNNCHLYYTRYKPDCKNNNVGSIWTFNDVGELIINDCKCNEIDFNLDIIDNSDLVEHHKGIYIFGAWFTMAFIFALLIGCLLACFGFTCGCMICILYMICWVTCSFLCIEGFIVTITSKNLVKIINNKRKSKNTKKYTV